VVGASEVPLEANIDLLGLTFHGIEFNNKGNKDIPTALDSEKHIQEARSSQ